MAFRKTVDPNCVALVKFTPDEEGNIKNFPTDENANGVSGFNARYLLKRKETKFKAFVEPEEVCAFVHNISELYHVG